MKLEIKGLGLCILLLVAVTNTEAQNKPLTRPSNVGDASIDGFKNNAFDIYGGSRRIEKELDGAEGEIEEMEKAGKVDATRKKRVQDDLNGTKKEVIKMQGECTELLGNSKGILSGAKGISPKTKSLKAVKNTNTSIKALNAAKESLTKSSERVDELTQRLETLK